MKTSRSHLRLLTNKSDRNPVRINYKHRSLLSKLTELKLSCQQAQTITSAEVAEALASRIYLNINRLPNEAIEAQANQSKALILSLLA